MTRTREALRTGGSLWGPERVAAGISLRQLENECGVTRGHISLMENGRMIPTSDEYHRIITALATLVEAATIEPAGLPIEG